MFAVREPEYDRRCNQEFVYRQPRFTGNRIIIEQTAMDAAC
jgi:hypothetical protein